MSAAIAAAAAWEGAPALTRETMVAFAQDVLSRAAAASSLATCRFRVAGLGVAVHFGTGGLLASYGARIGLPWMDGDAFAPDFEIHVLQAADIGLPVMPVWRDETWTHMEHLRAMQAAGIAADYPSGENVWRFFDAGACRGVLLVGTVADLPLWHAGAPLVDLLRYALAERGLRVVHGATLGLNGRGLLLVGDGGAGKSGTTLAGLRAGLMSTGDDYVAVGFEDGVPVSRLLYRFMKQDRAGLARHAPHAVANAPGESNWHGKIEFDPRPYFPQCLVEHMELKAVVIPRVTNTRDVPAIEPVTAGDALRVAMRTNLFNGPIDGGMRFFARLLQLPCYRISLVAEPAANGAALARLIEGFS